MTRFVDRDALVAAGVGVGMAVTIGISFLLVIPIEPVFWFLTLPAGLVIGYYANQRAGRRSGPWSRIAANAGLAGAITGIALALLLLGVKGLFFVADSGYPDFNRTDKDGRAIPPSCVSGVDCVYQRYRAIGRSEDLVAAGITDADSFGRFYWSSQLSTAGLLLVVSTAAGLIGGLAYGATNRRRGPDAMTPRETSGAS